MVYVLANKSYHSDAFFYSKLVMYGACSKLLSGFRGLMSKHVKTFNKIILLRLNQTIHKNGNNVTPNT
ncbi:hypothetical protein [Ehrlichia muris]|uniref:Uncharacterized protein n=1 Tax=Ehrlichia cf. muris str. EmCRT TaxID=1359167 RepID=A0A0F3NC67_9RICK|nr:hypothetical protein [Ehrlichia muris]KJV65663.1 hypothetical protein EMUCRT_0613 [Ehrlichia cf. muris str. EmCRT]